ncbi:Uncharacterised protein [Chromobacterium violaceum]|uniref:Uncharacterized protein n=1 Tax=Chromobacterium violaceum TaxID=536 RepID=A0A447TFA9_CHRVL|nr:Uncharacterised protein [Chromobacterium violaceum]
MKHFLSTLIQLCNVAGRPATAASSTADLHFANPRPGCGPACQP